MTKTAKTTTKTAARPRLPRGWKFKQNPDIDALLLSMTEGRSYSLTFKNIGYADRNAAGEVTNVNAFKAFDTKTGRGFDLNARTADSGIYFQLAMFGDEIEQAVESGYMPDFATRQWVKFELPAVGEYFTFNGKFEVRTIDLSDRKLRTNGPQLVAFNPAAIEKISLADFPERPDIAAAKKATNKANAEKTESDAF